MPKYLTSPSPEFDTVFESLSETAQQGVSASGMTLSRFFMMYMDDIGVYADESFVTWMDCHFVGVTRTGLLDDVDPVREIFALDGSQGAEGKVPESELAMLGKTLLSVS